MFSKDELSILLKSFDSYNHFGILQYTFESIYTVDVSF